MTISSTTNRVSYAGDGNTTGFSFPHRFLANADLTVILVVDSTGVETTQTITTDYTVSGAGDANGGTVTMNSAPASGETLVIINDPDLTQGTDLADGSALPAESVETVFDRLTIIAQRIRTLVDRSFRLPDGDTSGASLELPSPTANNMIRWNDDGDALENFEDVEVSGVTLSDNEIAAKVGTANADGLAVPQNSVVGRFGASLATLAVSASRLVGRASSGALKAMTVSEVLSLLHFPNVNADVTATDEDMNAVLTPYDAQTVVTGGDFNASSRLHCVRIGSVVTVTMNQAFTHTSSATPSSGSNVIPSNFRPSANLNNVFYLDGSAVRTVEVTTTGELNLEYRDWAGATSSGTSAVAPPTIQYVIT